MDVLVIGGTVFVGRAVVAEALARGDRVTTFNRGRSGPPAVGVTAVTGDRTRASDLAQLAGRPFDLVVDTCGYVAADVARAADLLAPSVGHYAFVSSINVYPGWPGQADYRAGGRHDAPPDATRDDVPVGYDASDAYGYLKAGAENAVLRAFGPQRTTLLRAGAIVGPYDVVGRLPWWIDRVSRGGEVLVPGRPDDPVRLIDARDVGRFALAGRAGAFEVTVPSGRDTRGRLMAAIRAETRADATFTYVDDAWLVAQGVEPWTEVPLWAGPGTPGGFAQDTREAEAAGLDARPLRDSVRDTLAWMRQVSGGWQPSDRAPGLAAPREAALLAAWHAGPGHS
jgi:2'-hydroxyisoflavone reductase